MAEATNQTTKVITGECRLSYEHIFVPFSNKPGQDAQYSCVLLIPKSDKATVKKIRDAEAAAAELGKGKHFGGTIPKNLKSIIHDGDEEADLDRNPEMAGHWYMSIRSKTAPGVVDRQVQPILDSTEVYSGCYVRASINAFSYNNEGGKGVSFGLNHIQKLRDGDFLGGRSKAEDDFDALDEDEESLI